MRFFIVLLVLMSLEIGVSHTLAQSLDSIKIEKDLEFGTSNEIVLGEFSSFSVDEQNRVYIADRNQTKVFVFDAEGNYLSSIGRRGEGPAEFTAITPITKIKVHQNKLYVPDYPDAGAFFPDRLQVFSLDDFSFLETVQLIPHNRNKYTAYLNGYFPQEVYPIGDNQVIVDYRRGRHVYKDSVSFILYFILDSSSEITKGPILEQQDVINLTKTIYREGRSMLILRTFPFLERSLFETSPNGLIYSARTGEFKIDVRTPEGDYIQAIQHPYKKVELSKQALSDHNRSSGNELHADMISEANNLPEFWPALNDMFVDNQNRLWVSTFTDNMEEFSWWVLDSSGDVLNKFDWPKTKGIKVANDDYFYTLEEDKDGFSVVVRYQIRGL